MKAAFFGDKNKKHKTLVDCFNYPKKGCGVVYENIKDEIIKNGGVIHTNCEVLGIKTIDKRANAIITNKGEFSGDIIISTAPFRDMVLSLEELDSSIKELAGGLKFRNTILVYIEIDSSCCDSSRLNSSLGNHFADLADFEGSQTSSLASPPKSAKNHESNTANTRIVLDTAADSSTDSSVNSSPSLAEGVRGWVKTKLESSSLRGSETTEAIQNKNMDCHENPCGFSRNDEQLESKLKNPQISSKNYEQQTEKVREARLSPLLPKRKSGDFFFSWAGGSGVGGIPLFFLRLKDLRNKTAKISGSVKQILNKVFRKDTSVASLPQYDEKIADLESNNVDCHEFSSENSRNDAHPLTPSAREGERVANFAREGERVNFSLKANALKTRVFEDNWIYVHSSDIATGRITNFANWTKDLRCGKTSEILCLEYWANDDEELWNLSDEKLILMAKNDLLTSSLVKNPAHIKNASVKKIHKSYPIYERGYKANLHRIYDALASFKDLYFIGRNGSFKYNNQDHSLLMGLLCADKILGAEVDLMSINTDYDYQESGEIGADKADSMESKNTSAFEDSKE